MNSRPPHGPIVCISFLKPNRPIFLSSFTHSNQDFLGLPLPALPATLKSIHFFTHCWSSFLLTCPIHLSLLSLRLTRSDTLQDQFNTEIWWHFNRKRSASSLNVIGYLGDMGFIIIEIFWPGNSDRGRLTCTKSSFIPNLSCNADGIVIASPFIVYVVRITGHLMMIVTNNCPSKVNIIADLNQQNNINKYSRASSIQSYLILSLVSNELFVM